jgi:hypothetical protein
MTKRQDRDSIYVKRQFDTEIIASIGINLRSGEAVPVTTSRSGPTGNVPLHENQLASRESVGCVRSP